MYKEHWIHSLLYFKFVELTLMFNVYIVSITLVAWERLQSGGCEGTISEAIFKRICPFLISIKRDTCLKNQISFVFSLA